MSNGSSFETVLTREEDRLRKKLRQAEAAVSAGGPTAGAELPSRIQELEGEQLRLLSQIEDKLEQVRALIGEGADCLSTDQVHMARARGEALLQEMLERAMGETGEVAAVTPLFRKPMTGKTRIHL